MKLLSISGVVAAAMMVAACQPGPPPRTGSDMIDPQTGALYPVFIDGSFSITQVIEDYIGRGLPNSTRRAIDNAQDAALAQNPVAPAVEWASGVRGNRGYVDLISWTEDRRAGEICGTIEHVTALKNVLRGIIVVCRASVDPGWRIDEVVWYGKPRASYAPQYRYSFRPFEPVPGYGGPVRKPNYKPKPNYGGPAPTPKPPYNPGPAPQPNYGPAAGTGSSGAGGINSGGAQNLSDVLSQP